MFPAVSEPDVGLDATIGHADVVFLGVKAHGLTALAPTLRILFGPATADSARAATTGCTLTPSKTEGPYFVDEKLNRSDIRTDPSDGTTQGGVPVALTFVVERTDGDCAALRHGRCVHIEDATRNDGNRATVASRCSASATA